MVTRIKLFYSIKYYPEPELELRKISDFAGCGTDFVTRDWEWLVPSNRGKEIEDKIKTVMKISGVPHELEITYNYKE